MSGVRWIKITTDIFDDEKILLIEGMPDGYAIITCWFKLLCLAGKQNNCGVFSKGGIVYTSRSLATIFRVDEALVVKALKIFEQFEMVETIDGVITISNWGKHQSLEQLEERRKYQREYQREYRKQQKNLAQSGTPAEDNNNPRQHDVNNCQCLRKRLRKHDVNTLDIDIDIDKEEEKEIDKEKESFDASASKRPPAQRRKYGEYQNVLLSDADIEKLQTAFPSDWQARIERLSSYMASTGKHYKNHLATIRNWAARDKQQQPSQGHPRSSSFDLGEIAKLKNRF